MTIVHASAGQGDTIYYYYNNIVITPEALRCHDCAPHVG